MAFDIADARAHYLNRLERYRCRQVGYASDMIAYDEGHVLLICTLEPEFLSGYPCSINEHAADLANTAAAYLPRLTRYTVRYMLAVRPKARDKAFEDLMESDLEAEHLAAELDRIAEVYGSPLNDDEVFIGVVKGEAPLASPLCFVNNARPVLSPPLANWLRSVIVLPEQLAAITEIGLQQAFFNAPMRLN